MVPVRAVITSTLPRGFGVEIRTSWLLEYDLELQSSKSVLLRRSDLSWQSPVGIRSGTVVANNAICHFINPLERVPESSFSHRHFNPADLLLSTNQLSGIITRFDLPKTWLLPQSGVAVEKLASGKFAKNTMRHDALQTIFSGRLDICYPQNLR